VGQGRAQPALQETGGVMGGDQRTEQLDHRLQQVDVDDLPDAGMEGDHRGERRGQPGDLVGQGDGRQQRRSSRIARQGRPATHGLGRGGEAGPRGIGPALAEAADPGDDQAGIAGQQHVGAQAESLELAGAQVLHQHVGRLGQPQQRLPAGVGLQVQHDGPLAAVPQLPGQRHPVARVGVAHAPGGVTVGRALHLDHVGAEIPQVAGTGGAGHHGGAVEHAQVVQRRPAHRWGVRVAPAAHR
jgi:hypothetical protein